MSEKLWAVRIIEDGICYEEAARSLEEANRHAVYADNLFKKSRSGLLASAEVVEYSGDEEDHAKDILWKTIYPQIS